MQVNAKNESYGGHLICVQSVKACLTEQGNIRTPAKECHNRGS